MKKLTFLTALIGIGISSFAAEWDNVSIPAWAGTNKEWQLQSTPSDDFNYHFNATNSRANFGPGNKWYNFFHNGFDGPGTTYWKFNHTSVDGDNLVIKASRWSKNTQSNPPYPYMNGLPEYKMDRPNDGINAGCITSHTKVRYPVFVEASVSVADIALASDVWLLSPDDKQEIDIIECYGEANGFQQYIHLSHHSFIRNPFTDYQPKDHGSWWSKSGISSFGDYCWNGGNRRYVRIGVNWIGPYHFEYFIDGELVRVLFEKAFATKSGNTWTYSYPTFTNGQLTFSGGYQSVVNHSTSTNYDAGKLAAASAASSVSVIDPYNYQNGAGMNKEMDIIINMESQDWHVDAGRIPNNNQLNNAAKNKMLVDWIRVYKPVASSGGGNTGGNETPIPGKVEAESYSAQNGIRTQNTSDAGGGQNVGWIGTGDWMDYKVNVASAGTYTVEFRVASQSNNIKLDLKKGNTVLTSVNSGTSGGWQTWKTVSKTVTLSAGVQTLRVVATGPSWNINYMNFVSGGNTGGGNTGGGSSGSIITIQAESFTNTDGTFNDGVVAGGGANKTATTINYVNKGDWMDYNVSIPQDGAYEIVYYISSPITGSTIMFGMGSSVWNTTNVPNNSNWDNYQPLTASNTANFTAGNHVIRLSAGAQNWTWNLDKFTMQRVSAMKRASDVELTEAKFSVYPNPATDHINVSLRNSELTETVVELYNTQGAKVLSQNISTGTEYQLNISDLANGMYIIMVNNGSEILNQRFIKK